MHDVFSKFPLIQEVDEIHASASVDDDEIGMNVVRMAHYDLFPYLKACQVQGKSCVDLVHQIVSVTGHRLEHEGVEGVALPDLES